MEKICIKVNTAWNKALQELLDIALKSAGINAMNGVSHLLNSIEVDEDYFKKLEDEKIAAQEAAGKEKKDKKSDDKKSDDKTKKASEK